MHRNASHLLIGHDAIRLHLSWVPAEESASWTIMFAEDGPVDVVKAIAGDQAVPTRCTNETLTHKRLVDHFHLRSTRLYLWSAFKQYKIQSAVHGAKKKYK